jgi:hypothetical protein
MTVTLVDVGGKKADVTFAPFLSHQSNQVVSVPLHIQAVSWPLRMQKTTATPSSDRPFGQQPR